MANGSNLPQGFVLDQEPQAPSGLPEGFVVDQTDSSQFTQKFNIPGEMGQPLAAEEAAPEPSGLGLGGIVEPVMAIGSGLASTVAGGLAGIVQSINPFADEGAGAEAVESIQKGGTYEPRTEAGKANLAALSKLMQHGVDIANIPASGLAGLLELITGQGSEQAAETVEEIQKSGLGKTVGSRVLEETGSPLAATIAETLPEAALTAAGYRPSVKAVEMASKATGQAVKATVKGAETAVGLAKLAFKSQSPAKRKISELLQEGSADVSTAKYEIKPRRSSYAGRAIDRLETSLNKGMPLINKDPVAREAIKQGFDEGVIAAVKGASPADKHQMLKMTANMQRGKKNARFAMENRPSDIVGENLMKRFKVVHRVNREAGKRLDEVAKTLKGKEVEAGAAFSKFGDDLDNMGIKSDGQELSFKGSDIEGVAGAENFISRINERVNSMDPNNAFELHRLKRYIDENVAYGKSAEGLTGKSERIVKELRLNIDTILDDRFPAYNKVNTRYSDTINAINNFQDAAGKKMDLTGPNADKAVGTLVRRLMSNTQSRVNLMDAIDSLEGVSKKYGGRFNDDLMTQMLFVDELDNVFKPVARTSFQGQIGQAIDRAARPSLKDMAADAAKAGIERVRNINEDQAFKSIKKLLTK